MLKYVFGYYSANVPINQYDAVGVQKTDINSSYGLLEIRYFTFLIFFFT